MKTVFKKERFYETSDIQLAATLHALNVPIIDIDRRDAGRCIFILGGDIIDIESTEKAYWSKGISMEPQALFGALKSIKARLYGERS